MGPNSEVKIIELKTLWDVLNLESLDSDKSINREIICADKSIHRPADWTFVIKGAYTTLTAISTFPPSTLITLNYSVWLGDNNN